MAKDLRKIPRFCRLLIGFISEHNGRHSVIEDYEETYSEIYDSEGRNKAVLWCHSSVARSILGYVYLSLMRSITMFRNNLKVTFRNFIRYKLFSFINVFGLAIGIATCMIITLWVKRETSYDEFNTKSGRIFRLERELFRDNAYSRWPITSGGYKQLLIDDFPEIENAMRLWRREFAIRDQKGLIHRQTMFATDNSIFEIFNYRLEEGDPETALNNPMSVVLTRVNAIKYLGHDDVIGESMTMEMGGRPTPFKVTGILEEVPFNSHIQFDMLVSITSYPETVFENIRSNYLYTYILAAENSKRFPLEDKLKMFVENRLQPVYGDLLAQGLGIHEVLKLHLIPVTDIHLDPSPTWEVQPQGSRSAVYIFSSIAALILIIACINFINLSTARANKRAREVGLRKTIGAFKNQLRKQFILESVLMAVISIPVTILIILLFIPVYNNVMVDSISAAEMIHFENLFFFTGVVIVVGIISGIYPALYMTRFDPVIVFKGGVFKGKGKAAFRRNMVVFQFVISIILIIGSLTVYRQMDFIRSREIGFEKDNVVIIQVRSRQAIQNIPVFRNELIKNSIVSSVCASSSIPGVIHFSTTGFSDRADQSNGASMIWMTTDHDFIQTYKMEMAAGRGFSIEFGSDTSGAVILNESGCRRLGWEPEEAVNKELEYAADVVGKVVGVVKDFNFRSVKNEVEPLAIVLWPQNFNNFISVRIRPGDIEESLEYIRHEWKKTFPGEQFNYTFLDSRIERLYENEKKMQKIFLVFSFFSIFVACLGLFGLAVYIVEEKTKEIGIRKVLGADFGTLYLLLSGDFFKWIIISNIIAWPSAWYYMNKWLQGFAYRADLSILLFFAAAIITLLIAFLTISIQIIRSALNDPVNSLRYE